MNSAIETWRVQHYANNVTHLSQQKGSRLAPVVRKETFTGKAEFFDVLSTATAQAKGARASDTPNLDITHDRRMVATTMYEWATLVDRKDKLAQIHNPESEYSKAAMNGLGRKMDDIIIAAALGAAASGEAGAGTANIAKENKVASVASSAIANLNLAALKNVKFIMDQNEVEGQRYMVCRAADIIGLLGETAVTSADYNSVKALVNGEVDTFLGFKFIRSERLPTAAAGNNGDAFKFDTTTGLYSSGGTALSDSYSSYKMAFAFVGDGIILGMNEGAKAYVEPRPDKSYDIQVYASMDFGAVRLEDLKVVPVAVKA